MGLRCLSASLTGEVFGRGVMSAFFHEVGRRRSKKEESKTSATGAANKSAFSLSNQEVIPSGPDTLFVLSADNFLRTENSDIGRGGSCWCTYAYACTSGASPFTVIPDDEGLRALKHFFHQRTVKEPCSEKLLSPAKLVLTLNCFSFGGNYYKQTNGVATSTKTGPSYADLLTGLLNTNFSVEATALNVNSAVATLTTVMALPNGATSCTREELTQFTSVVNSHHPALKYTWKISNSSLAFLDVKIEIEGNGLCTSIYYKPIDLHS